MIIPGLDRLEGTAVSPDLLNNDDLWHEHTTEILELLEQENSGRSPEDCISMVQFCRDFASGKRTTLAMRRALASKEWKLDQHALKLIAVETRAKKPSTKQEVEPSRHSNRQKRKAAIHAASLVSTTMKKEGVAVPGIVLAVGGAYPYEEANEKFRKALKRVSEMISSDGLFATPEHACHVTVATTQKYNTEPTAEQQKELLDINIVEERLRKSPELRLEINKGPIKLVADKLIIPNGDAIVLLFKDIDGRIAGLRNATKTALGDYAAKMIIPGPTFIHSTIGRITSFPSCSRDIMLQRLENIIEGMTLSIRTMDLVLEDKQPFFMLFPEGVYAHWDLTNASPMGENNATTHTIVDAQTNDNADSTTVTLNKVASFLERDQVIVASLVVIVLSVAVAWLQ
jgi:hypothetical protein